MTAIHPLAFGRRTRPVRSGADALLGKVTRRIAVAASAAYLIEGGYSWLLAGLASILIWRIGCALIDE